VYTAANGFCALVLIAPTIANVKAHAINIFLFIKEHFRYKTPTLTGFRLPLFTFHQNAGKVNLQILVVATLQVLLLISFYIMIELM